MESPASSPMFDCFAFRLLVELDQLCFLFYGGLVGKQSLAAPRSRETRSSIFGRPRLLFFQQGPSFVSTCFDF